MKERVSKAIDYYFKFGVVYGACRSYFWLTRLNDSTINIDNKVVYHQVTIPTFAFYSSIQMGMTQAVWPLFILNDLGTYEKHRLGIKERNPPFPFNNLYWKDEK
jgi:hypothetical protein